MFLFAQQADAPCVGGIMLIIPVDVSLFSYNHRYFGPHLEQYFTHSPEDGKFLYIHMLMHCACTYIQQTKADIQFDLD